jgi:F0F1-type ATP synthase membrane subunit c/vacuolar-type H+-ATPase subunit K
MKMINQKWMWVVATMLTSFSAFAEESAHAAGGAGALWSSPLAVGLGIALAVIGAATAQGRIGAAFMEGVSRNPAAQKSMFVPLILSLVFVETLVLFTFLIVSGLSGKF